MSTATMRGLSLPRSEAIEVLVALGLSIGAAVSLGFSRFAYALLLPPMRTSLHWTYVEAGGMNTANAAGYIFGSMFAAWFSKRLGIKNTFLWSMAVSAFALVGSGLVDSYGALATLRFVGGLSTATLFIVGASLATAVNAGRSPSWSALLVAVYITGVGSGIVVSGLIVPPILAHVGAAGWQLGWLWLGALSFALMALAVPALQAVPLQPGRDADALPVSEALSLWPTFAAYAFFGAGYVSFMTFIIVLLQQQGSSAATAATFWVVLGAASVVGTLAWGRLLKNVNGGKGLAVVSLVLLVGALPVLVWPGLAAAFIMAIVFGGSFMAGPSAVTLMVRRLTAPHLATAAIGAMTVAFAVGQAAGPILAGYVSDLTGTVSAGLWTAPLLLVLAAVLAPLQRNRQS